MPICPPAPRLPLAGAALVAALSGAAAHEGHDHGAPPAVLAEVAPRAEAASETFELVAVARAGRLRLYLDGFRTNAPVEGAELTVETPEGERVAAPAGDGGYALAAPWLAAGGRYDLLVTVAAPGEVDVLPLVLTIPEAPAATGGEGSATWFADVRAHLADGGSRATTALPVLAGFLAGLAASGLAGLARPRRRARLATLAVLAIAAILTLGGAALAHEGHTHEGHAHEDHPTAARAAAGTATTPAAHGDASSGDAPAQAYERARRLPDGGVFVPKPTQHLLAIRTDIARDGRFHRAIELPGRVIPDPNASGVVQSSVGGRLSPPPSGAFPRLGTRVRRGEVLALVTPPVQAVDASDMRQTQGQLDQQIAIQTRKVERSEKLAVTGAVARSALDDARAELAGLRDRRAALDRLQREPEALVAPVDGVIAQGNAVAGQMAAPGTLVFQIVDPDHLWVEALSFDPLAGVEGASARLADGRSLVLAHRGAGLADRNQAVPVQFAVTQGAAGLRLGQFVTVQAATASERSGLALPRAGVVRGSDGQDRVYEHVAAERFAARPVRVEPLDAARVLVADGIGAGARVVVQGAELLDQVR